MIVDELITILGFEIKDREKLDAYKNAVGSIVSELQTMAKVGAGAMSAMLVGLSAVNKETAKLANLAETVGLNYELVDGLGGAIKAIGLDYEHVADLAEEMSNKIGESKSIYEDWLKGDKLQGKELKLVGGVEDAFKGLDFSIVDKKFKDLKLEEKFKMFSGMSATKQFELVMDTASTMKDTQKAVSMVDILMGGEANKILGYLRSQGLTLSELLDKKREMNFLDKEGIDGAKAYAKELADTTSIFGSIGKELSGIAGEYLTPILKKMNDWFRLNKKIIQTKLKEYVANVFYAFERLGDALQFVWRTVDYVATALGGWDVVLPILGLILAYFNPWKALIVGVMLVADDLFAYFSGGKSIIGNFIAYFKQNFPLLSSIIESIGHTFSAVFGLFKALYDALIVPVLNLFKRDSSSASDSILFSFRGSFEGLGMIVKSFYEIVASIFKMLTALIRGDFEAVKQYGSELFSWLGNGFDGVVMTLTNGAATFRSVWADAIDWIMSKINWVSNKIDAVKSVASDVGSGISESVSSVWDGAVNFFGGGDEKNTEKVRETINNTVHHSKEIVNNIKEKINHEKVRETINNTVSPVMAHPPVSRSVHNNNSSNTNHFNSRYNINVTANGANAHEVAETIKNRVIDTKAIEKATINKIKPIYGAK